MDKILELKQKRGALVKEARTLLDLAEIEKWIKIDMVCRSLIE